MSIEVPRYVSFHNIIVNVSIPFRGIQCGFGDVLTISIRCGPNLKSNARGKAKGKAQAKDSHTHTVVEIDECEKGDGLVGGTFH